MKFHFTICMAGFSKVGKSSLLNIAPTSVCIFNDVVEFTFIEEARIFYYKRIEKISFDCCCFMFDIYFAYVNNISTYFFYPDYSEKNKMFLVLNKMDELPDSINPFKPKEPSSTTQPINFDFSQIFSLPPLIVKNIFSYVTPHEVVSLAGVKKEWKRFAIMNIVWEAMYQRDFKTLPFEAQNPSVYNGYQIIRENTWMLWYRKNYHKPCNKSPINENIIPSLQKFAKEHNYPLHFVSASTGSGVGKLFTEIARFLRTKSLNSVYNTNPTMGTAFYVVPVTTRSFFIPTSHFLVLVQSPDRVIIRSAKAPHVLEYFVEACDIVDVELNGINIDVFDNLKKHSWQVSDTTTATILASQIQQMQKTNM
eukprot:Phypoly_transcript_11947.p1 GENE.Phypoly_transcript_11947~~Phypoly_transcript_11947.p1  ORF type:complete len:365 (+),score=42.44 Phypoly_transcript_11947:27-1121(+)